MGGNVNQIIVEQVCVTPNMFRKFTCELILVLKAVG